MNELSGVLDERHFTLPCSDGRGHTVTGDVTKGGIMSDFVPPPRQRKSAGAAAGGAGKKGKGNGKKGGEENEENVEDVQKEAGNGNDAGGDVAGAGNKRKLDDLERSTSTMSRTLSIASRTSSTSSVMTDDGELEEQGQEGGAGGAVSIAPRTVVMPVTDKPVVIDCYGLENITGGGADHDPVLCIIKLP